MCWGHNRDLFEGHSNSQTTHRTGKWKCRGQLKINERVRKYTFFFFFKQNGKSVLISLHTGFSVYLALQVLTSEVGAAGFAVVVADMATAEVAGAEMVAAAVIVAVCIVCKVLHKDTPTVKIRDTNTWKKIKP